MSKYSVETYYTCSFKIVHKLDEINEKNLSEIENRKDGKFEIIDVRLNNRKTKVLNKSHKVNNNFSQKDDENVSDITSIVTKNINEANLTNNTIESNNNVSKKKRILQGLF